MSNKAFVSTFPAGEFVCDNCGRNSYFSLVAVDSELNENELNDFYRKLHGAKPPEGASAIWLMHPASVKCAHCDAEYDTYQQVMEDGINDLEEDEL